MKKIVYVDMDDTIADFHRSARDTSTDLVDESKMYEPNFFLNLSPVPGAKGAIRQLITLGYDVWILTQPLAELSESYSDKVKWIGIHFPHLWDKVIMTQDKGLHMGDYLIDDNILKWKVPFERNGGAFVHFNYHKNYNEYNSLDHVDQIHEDNWRRIVAQLSREK